VLLRLVAKVVEDHAGLDARELAGGVDVERPVQVLREVDDDGDVRDLPGEARPAAAREDRRAMLAARGDRREDVVDRLRDHDADRDHPVVRPSGRIERAVARPEANLALELGLQLLAQAGAVDVDRADRRRAEASVRLRGDSHAA
jgi:hypothetical protein